MRKRDNDQRLADIELAYRAIRGLGADDSYELTRMICAAVVNGCIDHYPKKRDQLNDQERRNPFQILLSEGGMCSCFTDQYTDLASAFLQQFEDANLRQQGKEWDCISFARDSDFISLSKFMREKIPFPKMNDLPKWVFVEPSVDQMIWAFFEGNKSCMDDAIDETCRLVTHGVPLYELREDTFCLIPFTHPDYIYLSKKHEYDEVRCSAAERIGLYPEWAKRYHFNVGHIRAHSTLFGWKGAGHSAPAVAALREAMWRHIGLLPVELSSEGVERLAGRGPGTLPLLTATPNRPQNQRMADIAADTLARYNNDGTFGPNHCRVLEKTVKHWLKETYGLSGRAADAIWVYTKPSRNGDNGHESSPEDDDALASGSP